MWFIRNYKFHMYHILLVVCILLLVWYVYITNIAKCSKMEASYLYTHIINYILYVWTKTTTQVAYPGYVLTSINFVTQWLDPVGIRTPDLPHKNLTLYRFGHCVLFWLGFVVGLFYTYKDWSGTRDKGPTFLGMWHLSSINIGWTH